MLKFLVKSTAFGIAIFLGLLSAIFLSAEEDDFPPGTNHILMMDFSKTEISKESFVTLIDKKVSSLDLFLGKIVPDPDDFLHSNTLYVFGDSEFTETENIEWFRPKMSGQYRPASQLGNVSLDGKYVSSGSRQDVDQLASWLDTQGVKVTLNTKSAMGTLQYALINTGAWIPLLTCVVLLTSLTASWYVLRARARTLKVLNGTRPVKIVSEDLLSLLAASVPPALIAFVIALGILLVSGRWSFVLRFASVFTGFIAIAWVSLLICALLVSALTWPSIQGIAHRTPPERQFRFVSEILKIVTLFLVAISLPGVGSAIGTATQISAQSSQWAALNDQVKLRIGTSTLEEFESLESEMGALINAASDAGSLTFSYAEDPTLNSQNLGGNFDGFMMVNRGYLEAIASLNGYSSSAKEPMGTMGERVVEEDLPANFVDYLKSSYEIWNRDGQNQNGFAERLHFYRYGGESTIPGLLATEGEMKSFKNPIIVVVDDPATTFNDTFLAATLSTGNIIFDDSEWLKSYIGDSPLVNVVLSVDQVSESGLRTSQQMNQTASTLIFSFILVILALIACLTISGIIFSLSHSRRIFVQHTSGWTWQRILAKRMIWETLLAIVVSVSVAVPMGILRNPEGLWVLIAIPLYVLVSAAIHNRSVKRIFVQRLSRNH